MGDGSPDGMWKAIQQAVDLRRKVAVQQKDHAVAEKQAANFGKDALVPDTAKGKVEVNTGNLNVGAKLQVGDQTLTVAAVDPDTLDVDVGRSFQIRRATGGRWHSVVRGEGDPRDRRQFYLGRRTSRPPDGQPLW